MLWIAARCCKHVLLFSMSTIVTQEPPPHIHAERDALEEWRNLVPLCSTLARTTDLVCECELTNTKR